MTHILLILSFLFFFGSEPQQADNFQTESISFTLHNSSAISIPLRIPGVMNPNLSPFSDSGVTLKVGQEIYFYPKGKKSTLGKKQILLIVSEDLADKRIDVAKFIKEKKKTKN